MNGENEVRQLYDSFNLLVNKNKINIANLRLTIKNLLIEAGLSQKLKGFECIQEAILINVLNKEKILGRRLYYRLSPIFEVSPIIVEKRITYAIKSIDINEFIIDKSFRCSPKTMNDFILISAEYCIHYCFNNKSA